MTGTPVDMTLIANSSATVQAVMWEVFAYAKIMNGFDSLEGVERDARRAEALAQDVKIREMLIALIEGGDRNAL